MLSELLGELIVKPLFWLVGYHTGKPLVRLLSLGRLHVSLTAEPAPRRSKRKRRQSEPSRPWYSVTFTCAGKRYLDPECVALLGLLAWAAAITVAVLIFRHT